jgi:hypothetical protein
MSEEVSEGQNGIGEWLTTLLGSEVLCAIDFDDPD